MLSVHVYVFLLFGVNSGPLKYYTQFVQQYNDLHQHVVPILTHTHKGTSSHKMNRLNIDDTDSESDANNNGMTDPSRPWLDEWNT